MCPEFGEDISFRSRVIAVLSEIGPASFKPFYAPFANVSWNFNFFSIIIDNHLPENISAVVWFWSGEKPRTSSPKVGFEQISRWRKTIQAQMKSEIALLFWLTQGLQGYKTFWGSTTKRLGVMSRFASVVAIAAHLWADWAENLISSPRFLVYPLAKFQVSRPYSFGCTLRFTAEA